MEDIILVVALPRHPGCHPLATSSTHSGPHFTERQPKRNRLHPHLEALRIYGCHLLSALRLSIVAEQRDWRDSLLKLVEVISDGKNRRDGQDDGYDGYAGLPYDSPSPYPTAPTLDANGGALPPWPEAVVSGLLLLQEYVDKVEYEVETGPD